MFTGIIESMATVKDLEQKGSNLEITLESPIAPQLKIDQSLSHNGVCLTVVWQEANFYKVQAIKETLDKSNIGQLKIDDSVNLERAMKLGDRLDGHLVQGHVDCTAKCTKIKDKDGSWHMGFEYRSDQSFYTIEKGSITINGVSLTVFNSKDNSFSVAIIPYTYEHTNLGDLKIGDLVNLEFDILGKYIQKIHLSKL